MLIYKCVNQKNEKIYIGKTKHSLEKRKKQHLYDMKSKRYKSIFHDALNKYGLKNFSWYIEWHGDCSKNWLNNLEKYYIYFFDSYKNGYNMTEGGEGGFCWSKERFKDLQELLKRNRENRDNTYLKGKNNWVNKISKEDLKIHMEKMLSKRDNTYLHGKNNPFCKLSPEKRMEIILKGNAKRKLFRHTDESKLKMSKTLIERGCSKGRKNPSAKVYKLISPSGEIFIVKDGLLNFCNELNLSFSLVRKNMNNGYNIEDTTINKRTRNTKNAVGWEASQCL